MFHRARLNRLSICCTFAAYFLAFGQMGCTKIEPIVTYSIDKPDRLLAALIPHEGKVWVIKVSGPDQQLQSQVPLFREFVESIHFPKEKSEPAWILPSQWKAKTRLPSKIDLRYAILEIGPQQQPFQLRIVAQETEDSKKTDEFILKKVNRWRALMSLPAVESKDLVADQIKLQGDKLTAAFVNIQGTLSADPITFDVPKDWTPTAGNQFSLYAFQVGDRQQSAGITISTSGGSVLANVNRWQNQVRVPLSTAENFADEGSYLQVDDVNGFYVQLQGPEKTILGLIVPRDNQMWFIKWMGHNELAKQQKETFEAFVRSIEFAQ